MIMVMRTLRQPKLRSSVLSRSDWQKRACRPCIKQKQRSHLQSRMSETATLSMVRFGALVFSTFERSWTAISTMMAISVWQAPTQNHRLSPLGAVQRHAHQQSRMPQGCGIRHWPSPMATALLMNNSTQQPGRRLCRNHAICNTVLHHKL